MRPTPLPSARSYFAALDGDAVGNIRIDMHPSTEIVRSAYPIVTIWAMNSGEQELAAIDNWRGEDALVSRPYHEVEVRALPPGGAAFLLSLATGWPLGEAAEAALADDRNFDVTGNLAGLIGSGLVRGHRSSGAAAMTNVFPVAARSESVPVRIIRTGYRRSGMHPLLVHRACGSHFPGRGVLAVW